MEWTLGITDVRPERWRTSEPHWEDERVAASSGVSFFALMDKLCQTAIRNRREYDHGIDEHLWTMKIMSLEDAMKGEQALQQERLMNMLGRGGDSDESDDEEDDDEKKYRGNVVIADDPHYEEFAEEDEHVIGSDTKIDKSLLPQNSIIKVTYDMGTTTTLYLKVLSVKSRAVQSLLEYFTFEADSEQMERDLQSVPAYSLPAEQQIDAFYPHASRALLGYYVPIFTSGTGLDAGENRRVMGPITLGLLGKFRSERDSIFCTMESRGGGQDLMFCPAQIELNEFMQVVNRAWTPRDPESDTDGLAALRYDYISRWIMGSGDDVGAEEVKKMIAGDNMFGPKALLFQMEPDHEKSSFDFKKVFPRTYSQLTSGKFRWVQYTKGSVLRVVVGRGTGHDDRQCEGKQIIKAWKKEFTSFHEMLCAIECSWVWQGQEMTGATFIPEYDADLGPSRPLPTEPPSLGDSPIIITRSSDKKELVTALAISEEIGGKTVLYSGHDDGTLKKWNLDDDSHVWSKQIYADGRGDFSRYDMDSIHIRETPGVAGIAVRPGPLVYTWSDAYNGYPDDEFDDRSASVIKVWSGADCALVKEIECNVNEGSYPSIATVVFCKVKYEEYDVSMDSIVVGLHCCCDVLNYNENYTGFDLDDSCDFSEGNILPFLEDDTSVELPSWRGHRGMIRAMAVANSGEYLVSFSIKYGTGKPDSAILWDLSEAGVPLYRLPFRDVFEKNIFKQALVRLGDISGVCVNDRAILVADNYGDTIASVTIEDDKDGPYLALNGYANIGNRQYDGDGFHGRMASSGNHAVMAMEMDQTAWVFPIQGVSDHKNLDRRDGNPRKFPGDFSGEQETDLSIALAARSIAVGKVEFPPFGGNKPTRKRKQGWFGSVEDTSDGLGNGGPLTLALRGRHLVAGFANGTLTRYKLPVTFENKGKPSLSSNVGASASSLPSDEWHVPHLDSNADDE